MKRTLTSHRRKDQHNTRHIQQKFHICSRVLDEVSESFVQKSNLYSELERWKLLHCSSNWVFGTAVKSKSLLCLERWKNDRDSNDFTNFLWMNYDMDMDMRRSPKKFQFSILIDFI